MDTRFVKLNDGWNAEPNAPAPVVARLGNDVVLEFRLNPFQFKKFSKGDRARLVFRNSWRYRLGGTTTTTDLMLHRIANQWGYNLGSRSMDLQAIAFPALIAADDGWVQYLSEAEELSVWTTVCNQEVQQATSRFSTTATIELGKWTASVPRSLRVCTQN